MDATPSSSTTTSDDEGIPILKRRVTQENWLALEMQESSAEIVVFDAKARQDYQPFRF